MSIQSEIERINSNVANTYSVLGDMGADMPETRNTANLANTAQTVKVVRYDAEQALNETQKAQARNNIGATGVYVGSGEMPEGYTIQIDTNDNDDPDELAASVKYVDNKFNQLSEEKADKNAIPNLIGYATETYVKNYAQPKGNYATTSELSAEKTAREQAVASLNARLGQQTIAVPTGSTQADAESWLKSNGDKTKLYLMPDETFWIYTSTTEVVNSGGGYTNLIDGTNGYIKEGYRYSASSSSFKAVTDTPNFAAFVIPVPTSGDLTIRIRGMKFHAYYPTVYGGTTNTTFTNCFNDSVVMANNYDTNGDWILTFTNTKSISYIVSTGILTGSASDVIATVNEEIVEGGTTTILVEKWVSTGHGLLATNYDGIIATLNNIVSVHTSEIQSLKDGSGTVLTDYEKLRRIKEWDSPIYDANIPVFQLSAEKQAITNTTHTPDNIYAKYDALMAKHPRYITKTDLGLCSDGKNHVYRYDFKEPEPLHESDKEWSETKTKAIIVTGIHYEWAGIYAMYNALEEIADNTNLRNFRRNTHLIVVPVANPYATITSNYQSGLSTPNSYGVRNANGVEIHRNFEVDWTESTEGSTHYGGSAPLSEVETQYIDNIMKNNTDASVFLSCHNCGVDTFWGTGFIWASTATKYMTNMGYRVIDKLSDAWMDKYGDTLTRGIAEYKTDLFPNGETRLGWTGLSTSPGTEAKQATKYGIQGTNVEICDPFQIHGTKANPESSMSAFTMSRGAEVYANFLLTTLGVYDFKDKEQYYK